LRNEAVQVFVVWSLNTEVASAYVVDGFIVHHEAAVRVLESGVGSQNGVVRLNHRGGNLWSWVDTELELALLAIVDGQTFHQQGTEPRYSSTTEEVEDEETLQARALVGDTSKLVQDLINELLSKGGVTTSVVVRCIFLASDHMLGVEEATISASADLIDDVGLKIAVDCSWDIFALA